MSCFYLHEVQGIGRNSVLRGFYNVSYWHLSGQCQVHTASILFILESKFQDDHILNLQMDSVYINLHCFCNVWT